jgi:putative endonuclease
MTTNYTKTVLYTGVTNNLMERLKEHYHSRYEGKTFVRKYKAFYVLYFEEFKYIDQAIKREKEIKGWVRQKKVKMTEEFNPEWRFLNEEIMEWPPATKLNRIPDASASPQRDNKRKKNDNRLLETEINN